MGNGWCALGWLWLPYQKDRVDTFHVQASDDATVFLLIYLEILLPFHRSFSLEAMISDNRIGLKTLSNECIMLYGKLGDVLNMHAYIEDAGYGRILAYEINGFGSYKFDG